MITIKNVNKVFKNKNTKVQALKNINVHIDKGDIFGFIGYSGAGKSTLVRLVNLLEKPTEGEVVVNGKNLLNLSKSELRNIRKSIGMIFQNFNLLNSKTVYDNIAIPLILEKKSKEEIEKRVYELLDFVGLKDKANTYPSKLSGGQKQRVAIARSLATNPSILLCDEATSALDPKTTQSILNLLKRIHDEMGITILIITHEMNVIKEICNKVAVMEDGEIVEQGNVVDVFGDPKHETTKDFVKTILNKKVGKSLLNNQKNCVAFNLTYVSEDRKGYIISDIAKNFDVSINLLSATVTEIKEKAFTDLLLSLEGSNEEVKKAFNYIKQKNIAVERMDSLC